MYFFCGCQDPVSDGVLGRVHVGSVQPSWGSLEARVRSRESSTPNARNRSSVFTCWCKPRIVIFTTLLIYIFTPIPMIGLPELTLDGTIKSVQVLLELLGEPMNAYGLKHARNWSLDCRRWASARRTLLRKHSPTLWRAGRGSQMSS